MMARRARRAAGAENPQLEPTRETLGKAVTPQSQTAMARAAAPTVELRTRAAGVPTRAAGAPGAPTRAVQVEQALVRIRTQKPNVPGSCTSNADCGDSGPCALKYCYNSSNLFACEVDADCQTTTGASAGPCVPIAYCSKNQDYLCANPGSTCQALDVSQDLGVCQKATVSVCEHAASCDVTQYAVPAVPISALPDAAAGLIASVDGKHPSGDTPTGPALSGALQQAKTWATAHRDHRVVTVLVTDGLPTECSPSAGDALAALAKAGVTSSPSINTFVSGVFGAEDATTNAPATVNQIAQQGGTDHAFIVDTKGDVAAQAQAALEAIRSSGHDCRFQVPMGPGGGALDAGKVNVTLSTATQSQVVKRVSDASACDLVAGRWYYELGGGTPSQINVCL